MKKQKKVYAESLIKFNHPVTKKELKYSIRRVSKELNSYSDIDIIEEKYLAPLLGGLTKNIDFRKTMFRMLVNMEVDYINGIYYILSDDKFSNLPPDSLQEHYENLLTEFLGRLDSLNRKSGRLVELLKDKH